MIKFFCDLCEGEIKDVNDYSEHFKEVTLKSGATMRLHWTAKLHRENGHYGAAVVCLDCLKETIFE